MFLSRQLWSAIGSSKISILYKLSHTIQNVENSFVS